MKRPRHLHHPLRVLIAALVVTAVLVAVVLLTRTEGERSAAPQSDDGAATQDVGRKPSAAPPPVSVHSRSALTVPDSSTFGERTFFVEAGSTYVVTFTLSTFKSRDAPGEAMYVGASFRCGPDGEERSKQSRGGTQNLLPGERMTLENRLLLTPSHDGLMTCEVSVSSPYDDIAAAGTRIPLDVEWQAERVEENAVEVPSDARLPMVVAPGGREFAFARWFPAGDLAGRRVDVLSSLHLTTCTGVNGSAEEGRTWCSAEDVDLAGSRFHAEARADVVDSEGRVCQTIGTSSRREALSRDRHHRLLPVEAGWAVPAELCGEQVRVGVVMENSGPAPLVVHSANSSMITTVG